jgi:serine phosphatase RsbU (regulator of sigma subunit)/tetratricopeptide (TPR) repeat protein
LFFSFFQNLLRNSIYRKPFHYWPRKLRELFQMSRRVHYFLILFFFYIVSATAHPIGQLSIYKIDSLKSLLSSLPDDTSKINRLNQVAKEFIALKAYSKADSCARLSLKLSSKFNYKKYRSDSYTCIATAYLSKNNYAGACDFFMKSLILNQKQSAKQYICADLRNLGTTYQKFGKLPSALSYATQSLELANELNNLNEKIQTSYLIGNIWLDSAEYKLALPYFFNTLFFSKHLQNKEMEYISLKSIADAYDFNADYNKAIVYYKRALLLATETGDKDKIELCASRIGLTFRNLGDLNSALDYWLNALKLAEEIKNKTEIANLYSWIGGIYLTTNKEQALIYLEKGFRVATESGDQSLIARHMRNKGIICCHTGDTAKAIDYFSTAIRLNKEVGAFNQINPPLNHLANIYEAKAMQQKDPDSSRAYRTIALSYFTEALHNAEKLNNRQQMLISNLLISKLYMNQLSAQKAESFLRRALDLSISIGEVGYRMDIYEKLSDIKSKQDKGLQLDNYKKYIAIRDSVYNNENSKKMMLSELNFDVEKKRSLEQANQEKINALSLAESKRQKTISWSIAIVACFILAIGLYVYFNYLQKQKINTELHIQNKRIEIAHKIIAEKNNEITNSINYALNIQKAILPDKDEISQLIKESFVLFKPKDIVSGDFYFAHLFNEKIFIAVADCTGHGVPGGFMSMIGSEKLKHAVKLTSDPGEILSLLNNDLKLTLQHSEPTRKLHDGMDIALCVIDTKNNQMEFSGANRPLWLIRKESKLIEEIRGTIASIGGYTESNTFFQTHTLQLEQGDTIYLCSDGYADQFGLNNKKLTTKNLKMMLMDIRNKSLTAQHQHLENFHTHWKENQEQTDDILIIGLQL